MVEYCDKDQYYMGILIKPGTLLKTAPQFRKLISGESPMLMECRYRKGPQAENRLRTGFSDGDGGIRTHVPRRANAFRVRPVMTTSIRLLNIGYTGCGYPSDTHSFIIISELPVKGNP